MKKVSGRQVVTPMEALGRPLPAGIQEALGELVGAAREGLLALSVGVGLSVVRELMEAEVCEVVGPKGKHNPDRTAKRHGHERGSMTLGGRRVEVSRPRIRSADDERELPVETYEYFADRDPLTVVVMNRMLAGVSARKYAAVGEPVGEEVERESRSTGKSTISELFVERTKTALGELMGRPLADVRLAVMMLDGIDIAERTHVVALGITTDGVKIPLGLWEGSTENATLARSLLSDLVDRGLDPEQAILFVIDGGKALRRAIKDVFGEQAPVHRRHRHKERNVTDLLPERDRPVILAKLRGAWSLEDAGLAQERLERLASELERTWPDAARLAAGGPLGDADVDAPRDLGPARQDAVLDQPVRVDDRDRSLHPAQRKALAGRRHAQAVDRRGHARRRAAVRRIIGYRDLAKLVIAIERHAARTAHSTATTVTHTQVSEAVTV
jgi:putative transposase